MTIALLTKALADVRQELWVDYCLQNGRTDADPRPFDARPVIRIIDAHVGLLDEGPDVTKALAISNAVAFAARMKVRSARGPSERARAIGAEEAAQQIVKEIKALDLSVEYVRISKAEHDRLLNLIGGPL